MAVGGKEQPHQAARADTADADHPPRDIGHRAKNEAPVEFRLATDELPANRRLDPCTLEVVAWDADAEKPLKRKKYERELKDLHIEFTPVC